MAATVLAAAACASLVGFPDVPSLEVAEASLADAMDVARPERDSGVKHPDASRPDVEAIRDVSTTLDVVVNRDVGTSMDAPTSPTCDGGGCPNPFPSTGMDDAFAPTTNVTLAPGVYNFTTIEIPMGVTVSTGGIGVLDLRATGTVNIAGTVELSGGSGQAGTEQSTCTAGGGGGGDTGVPFTQPIKVPGAGGEGEAGGEAGGRFGGGVGGSSCVPDAGLTEYVGGGGGGYAGGGGGSYNAGEGLAGGSGAGGTPAGSGGIAGAAAYNGGAGVALTTFGGGGGGSIGVAAFADLAVATTFQPGSGGGGGSGDNYTGGGGGGGGGALRIASATTITLSGAMRATGGAGGGGTMMCGTAGGGGGSGGVIYLSAPSIEVLATGVVDVSGGAAGLCGAAVGGVGGLGRLRLSVTPASCSLAGMFTPPLGNVCEPFAAAGHVYIGRFPD
jgi:hypothetical protein